MEIIAHRGASHDAPENTLAAIRLAWAQQADAVEVDVRLTRDGEAVLLHDADLKRTTACSSLLADLDLATVRSLEAGTWKSPDYRGEKIPALAEVLGAVPPGKRLYLELKDSARMVPALQRAIAAGPLAPESIRLISFDRQALAAAKSALPGCGTLLLADGHEGARQRTVRELEALIAHCREVGFDGLDLGDNWPIDSGLVAAVHRAGLTLLVWTVNDPVRVRQLAEAGVDGITTDRPGWIRMQREFIR